MAAVEVAKLSKKIESLYNLSLKVYADFYEDSKVDIKKLPASVVFDLYETLYKKRDLCTLNFSICRLDVFDMLLRLSCVRTVLHTIFQALEEHGTKLGEKLCSKYCTNVAAELASVSSTLLTKTNLCRLGLRLGTFLGDAAWYDRAQRVLIACRDLIESLPESAKQTKLLIEVNHHLLRVQVIFSDLQSSEATYNRLNNILNHLPDSEEYHFNLAVIFTNFSLYHFVRNDFKRSYECSLSALSELHDGLPPKVKLDALRQASKSCVVRRVFKPAEILIEQALDLAREMFGVNHPKYADTQLDYGYFLLNSDCVLESVAAYEVAYKLRCDIFSRDNLNVAVALEDLSYALYVYEYSTGRFERARTLAEEAVLIMQLLLPTDHIMVSSPQRVKALILEEISIDVSPERTDTDMLKEAEALHLSALARGRKHFGEINVQTAKHYGNLGRLYQSMRKFDEAEKMQIKAIEIKEEILGKDDFEVGLSLGHLASLYNYHMERYEQALALYRRSIDISLKLFGPDYSGLEYDYRGLVHVHTKIGNREKVQEYQEMLINWRLERERLQREPKKVPLPQPTKPIQTVVESVMSTISAKTAKNPIADASVST